jgi:hypothetical protein
LLIREPHSRGRLRHELGERWPDWDPTVMAYAVSYLTGTVQVTPRGVWEENGPAALVRRTHQPQTPPLRPPQRHRTRSRRPPLDQRMERRPQTLRLDQDRRPDPRHPRRILHANYRLTTLAATLESIHPTRLAALEIGKVVSSRRRAYSVKRISLRSFIGGNPTCLVNCRVT